MLKWSSVTLAFLLIASLSYAVSVDLKASMDYLEVNGKYPGALILAQVMNGMTPNELLIEKALKGEGVTYKLEAALALKIMGYKVPRDLLEVESNTICSKAEKAFVYAMVGMPSWESFVEDVKSASLLDVIDSGLACACKAGFFSKLIGVEPPWIYSLLDLMNEVKSLEALIWCSALNELYGNHELTKELAKRLSPQGFLKNEIGLPDDKATAEFLIAFSLLKKFGYFNVTFSTTKESLPNSIKVVTVKLTQTVTVTETVTTVVTNTEYATVSGCVKATDLVKKVTYETTYRTAVISAENYVPMEFLVPSSNVAVISCKGSCPTIYVGEGFTVYSEVAGTNTVYKAYGGSWTKGPCGGQFVWTIAKGPLQVLAIGPCTATLTVTQLNPVTLLCQR
ncbi:hypothetical protein EYM_02640 [Ignicoccus islandicus DSM 13165]|uniref:Uncharacterized protein n=1 Tax=Ignicoccus islandicus DSM 13165 TaxID=940295 RepID=A0A0U3FKF0_9CREN|nr:hypothetical protein [Ignicoccus islandicus]ALU12342.1 hypothetical protein EYM_02640 [Ignicoccus islandicus DSM 13165]